MEAPKLNEYWHVQYGADKKTNIIVKVTEAKREFNPKNWRKNDFLCDREGMDITISGDCFIELFLKAERKTRVFSRLDSPLGRDIMGGTND